MSFCIDFRYVHNNIFFSFAVDADLEQLSRKCASDGDSSADNTNTYERVAGNLLRGESGTSNAAVCDGITVVEPNGDVDLSQVPTETQLAESEQATYASANNDLKGTKAFQEVDVPGLYNLAMAIIDYRGHRVVAQVCSEIIITLHLTFMSIF